MGAGISCGGGDGVSNASIVKTNKNAHQATSPVLAPMLRSSQWRGLFKAAKLYSRSFGVYRPDLTFSLQCTRSQRGKSRERS